MISVPAYLKDIVDVKKQTPDTLDLNVHCPCGCNEFMILGNIPEAEEDPEAFCEVHVLKVRCEQCGAERVIFDNRKNGFTAVCTDGAVPKGKEKYDFIPLRKKPSPVSIYIFNPMTPEEYEDEKGKNPPRTNLPTFSPILQSMPSEKFSSTRFLKKKQRDTGPKQKSPGKVSPLGITKNQLI